MPFRSARCKTLGAYQMGQELGALLHGSMVIVELNWLRRVELPVQRVA